MRLRLLVAIVALVGSLQIPRLGNVIPAGGTGGGGGGGEPAALLQASDIGSPIGGFIPPDPTGDSSDFGTALALRYRGGVPYLYTTGQLGDVVEFSIPSDGQLATALNPTPSWTTATATQQFGDIYQSAAWTDHDRGGTCAGTNQPFTGIPCVAPTGLCWDETDQRMYWSRISDYDNTVTSPETAIGYSTLNDSTHTGTGVGDWRLSDIPTNGGYGNRWAGQCYVIPSVFASQLGGRRLMVGPGGYHSISSNGPISMGPAAFAISPAGLTSPTNRALFAGTVLPMQNHPYGTGATPLRTLRPTSVPPALNLQQGDGIWGDGGGTGFGTDTSWAWGDIPPGMVWINGPNKRGILYIAQIFAGDASMTVLSSPAPTHTTAAVNALGLDVRVGYAILLHTDTTVSGGHYNFSLALITNINTSGANPVLTFDSMELGAGGNDTTGIPLVGTIANCGQGYQGGGGWASGNWDVGIIYDPDDYVRVANGTLAPDAVVIKSDLQMIVPSQTFPRLGRFSGTALSVVPQGAVYDPTAHRLYVYYHDAIGTTHHSQIVVYPVND